MEIEILEYKKLIKIKTYIERLEYLMSIETKNVYSTINNDLRYLNQNFYSSKEWKDTRNEIIIRDMGLDMGLENFPISGSIFVHHMNPLTHLDFLNKSDFLFNPNFLISVSRKTHNFIHYGNINHIKLQTYVERKSGDTKLSHGK